MAFCFVGLSASARPGCAVMQFAQSSYWRTLSGFTACLTADFQGKPYRLCVLQYMAPHEVANVGVNPHKNAKSGPSYIRTKKSDLLRIDNKAKESKPNDLCDKLYEDCGGVVDATSCGSVPRNVKQIANVKSKPAIKKEKNVPDPLFAVMEECKKEQSRADPFIRRVNAAPEAMCVLARDRQLNDMARFCNGDDQFSIVVIDPTFSLGEFSVTVTTYRHLQLVNRRTKKHPVLLGPMLVHENKTFQSYHYLASSMVSLCPQLCFLMAFGTDREKALGDAFTHQATFCASSMSRNESK